MNFNSPAVVMHTCDNPPCCNPLHLRVGTNAMNQRDAAKKGRAPAAKLIPEDVRRIRDIVRCGGSQSGAARWFGIHPSSVNKIISGRKWSYVD